MAAGENQDAEAVLTRDLLPGRQRRTWKSRCSGDNSHASGTRRWRPSAGPGGGPAMLRLLCRSAVTALVRAPPRGGMAAVSSDRQQEGTRDVYMRIILIIEINEELLRFAKFRNCKVISGATNPRHMTSGCARTSSFSYRHAMFAVWRTQSRSVSSHQGESLMTLSGCARRTSFLVSLHRPVRPGHRADVAGRP